MLNLLETSNCKSGEEVMVESISSIGNDRGNRSEVSEVEESVDNSTSNEIVISDDNSFCSVDEFVESTIEIDETSVTDNDIDDNTVTENSLRRSSRTTKGKRPDKLTLQAISTNEVLEPKTYNEAIKSSQKVQWIEAMKEEIKMLKKTGTWNLVIPPENVNIVSCKWTYKIKRDENDNIKQYKARLVARGFSQKYGSDYNEVFAPVVRQSTFRTMLSVAGSNKMIVVHVDVKSAFLNGVLENDIYMQQPPGFEEMTPQHVCKLKKSLYGLKQAANVWNKALHNVLIKGNFKQNSADPCFYTKYLVEEGNIYVLIYVDDILITAKNKNTINEVIKLLENEISNLGEIRHYLGLEVIRDNENNFCIRQYNYIKNLIKEFSMENAKTSKFPLDPGYGKSTSENLISNDKYRKLTGSLLYISVNTRPDIASSVSILAQKVCSPNNEDWNELKRILRYLKGTSEHYLKLSDSKVNNNNELIGYADANWAENNVDRKSNTGFIFQINNGSISWCCKKQTCVALSSTESEFISLSETCKEAIWLRNLLEDMNLKQQEPTVVFEDNQSCLRLVEDGRYSFRTKHIDTKKYFVKQYVDDNQIKCVYCPSEDMLADMLTKPLNSTKLEIFRKKSGVQVV